jgi:anti-anti-sigma factor
MSNDSEKVLFGKVADIPAIAIRGPFDFMSTEIDRWMDEQIENGVTTLVLDLTDAHYITAQGIATMYKMVKKLSEVKGLLNINGATEDMVELIKLGKMEQYITYLSKN